MVGKMDLAKWIIIFYKLLTILTIAKPSCKLVAIEIDLHRMLAIAKLLVLSAGKHVGCGLALM
ncbi:TPA: hypothetical protein I8Y90_001235 [Legionella pneumophila]|nr:hypothetical protein [Legionella pneumophila]